MKEFQSTADATLDGAAFNYKEKKPAALDLGLFFLFYLAASVYIPSLFLLPLREAARAALSILVTVFSIAVQVRLIRSFPGALGYIVTVLSVGVLTGSMELAALIGVLVTGACAFAWLCLTVGSPWLGLLPVAAYTASALLLRAPVAAALSLLPIPCALVMASALRRQTARVASICRISLALGATTLVALLVYLLRTSGSVTPSILRNLLEGVRIGATGSLAEIVNSVGLPQGSNTDATAYAQALIDTLFNYLPALAVILFTLLGWMLHTAIVRVALGNEIPKKAAVRMMSFDMSMASAILYFLALLLSWIFVSDDTALYGIVSGNICLALLPGMLMTSWIAINTLLLHRAPSCLSVVLYLVIFFLIFNFSLVMLPLCAAFGAVVIIVGRIRHYLSEKNS
ncbi:MAG: hypothetical protein IJW44_00430 [Clostridia bacterium]|nr:hypothetical protein [Clostridia bacterium]